MAPEREGEMIDPADLEKYFKLEADAEALVKKMLPHAQRVAEALHGKGVKMTGFANYDGRIFAHGEISEDEGVSIPVDYLTSPDWEAKVAEHHRKAEERHQKLMAYWEKQKKEREEDAELKELERLKKKYPDMG